MKFRNDFVTNSSSSSYIFRSNDLASFRKQVEEEINRLLTEEYMESCQDNNFVLYQYNQQWYQERFDDDFRWMADLTPLRKFDNNNISEIYSLLYSGSQKYFDRFPCKRSLSLEFCLIFFIINQDICIDSACILKL